MNASSTTAESELGGRLPLIAPDAFTEPQRRLLDALRTTRVRSAEQAGYTAVLPDGRLIGPFNAMLRAPEIADPLLRWAQAISHTDIPGDVREVVILTIAGQWQAEYVLYAHTAAARHANVPESAIAALRQGEAPGELRAECLVAYRLTVALLRDHRVPDGLYAEAVTTFGTETLVALVNLIGQYLNTSALLTCFRVPAP